MMRRASVERWEGVLPDTLFFETSKKPFDHPILLRRVGRDEFLASLILAHRLAVAPSTDNHCSSKESPLGEG